VRKSLTHHILSVQCHN